MAAKYTVFGVLSIAALLGGALCPAHAQYSYPQYLNDMRAYQNRRLANDLAQLRPTPANTPYQGSSGSFFAPAQKRRNTNWDEDLDDEDLRPLTPAEKARAAQRLREEAAEEATREKRREVAVAEQNRLAAIARRADEIYEREMAAWKKTREAEAAHAADLERRAQSGDYAAIVQSAKEANFGSDSQMAHDRVVRAANLGDMVSIEKIATIGEYSNAARYISDDQIKKCRQIAVAKGMPSYASNTASNQHQKGDTAGAVNTLKAAYALQPNFSNALAIVEYASLLSRPDEAATYLKEALALNPDWLSRVAVMRATFRMPVNRSTAPFVLSVYQKIAADTSTDSYRPGECALANIRLGDIYSGQDGSWRGCVALSPKYRDYYLTAAAKSPEYYVVGAALRLARLGDFDDAETLFQRAVDTKNEMNRVSAADFWRTRTDGKADSAKVLQLYEPLDAKAERRQGSVYLGLKERGDMYFFGQAGLAPDKERGLAFYRKGRSEENIDCVRRLAALTWVGNGVAKDEDAALQMLAAAAKFNTTDTKGTNGAAFDAVQMRIERDIAKSGDAKATLRTYEATLRTEIAKPFDPDPRAMELLGRALVAGDIGAGNAAAKGEGWALIERAAILDLPSAKTLLGLRLLAPGTKPTPADGSLAFERFFTAARDGDAAGGYGLGLCYRNGYGTAKDYAQANTWFTWAAERGYMPAIAALSAKLPEVVVPAKQPTTKQPTQTKLVPRKTT